MTRSMASPPPARRCRRTVVGTRLALLARLAALPLAGLPLTAGAQTVSAVGGATPAAIQSVVDAFRLSLGTLNSNVAGSFGTGRREINWDGVPDVFSAPNGLPADFFNVNSPRGVVFSTPGTGFQVSASAASGQPVEFGGINATYPAALAPFSPQRLFTAIGSNVVDVRFFVPGSTTPALTNGFGAVFTDVDLPTSTSLEFFDASGVSLALRNVPVGGTASESLSFLGVLFDAAVVSRVRIAAGNVALGPNDPNGNGLDVVVMDDFIYGEPRLAATTAVPEPATAALLAGGLGVLALGMRRRRAR